ncbi:Uncharacterised protein [Serratia fonticola]|nr:Uncharacterised protein [Serratia fonticola]
MFYYLGLYYLIPIKFISLLGYSGLFKKDAAEGEEKLD